MGVSGVEFRTFLHFLVLRHRNEITPNNRLGSLLVNLGVVFKNIWIWKCVDVCGVEFRTSFTFFDFVMKP